MGLNAPTERRREPTRSASVVRVEHVKCIASDEPGPRARAHKTFRIREHDRTPVHQCGRGGLGGTLGTRGTIEVRLVAPEDTRRMRDGKTSGFRRFRYAAQDPDRAPGVR